MKLTLKRVALKPTYTIGRLYVDGKYFCDTIEDKVRDLKKEAKVKGQTAIPYGTYEVTWSYSPRFKKFTPRLQNVPQFEGVLIHSGNTAADTEGCIIVGENKVVGKVINSRATVNKLYPIIQNACKQGKVTIEIV